MKITDSEIKKLIKEEIYKLKIEDVHGNITEELFDTSETSQEHKTSLAIESFRRLYRHLDPDTRFFFTRWLKKALIRDLSIEEAVELTSKITSASKGNAEPKEPNKK